MRGFEKLDQLLNSLASTTPTEKEQMSKLKEMSPGLKEARRVSRSGPGEQEPRGQGCVVQEFDPSIPGIPPSAEQLSQFEDKLNEQAAVEAAAVYESGRAICWSWALWRC